MVFSLVRPNNPLFQIDLFLDYPLPAEQLFSNAEQRLVGGVEVTVCGFEDLIKLKEKAGRPKDLADINALKRIKADRER